MDNFLRCLMSSDCLHMVCIGRMVFVYVVVWHVSAHMKRLENTRFSTFAVGVRIGSSDEDAV